MSKVIKCDFDGHLYSFNLDGWFNATEAASKYGKSPTEWTRLPETKKYLEGLIRRYGKIPYVKTSKARLDRGGGTWLHPKLAVRFAQWLDIDFAIWCDEQIDEIIRSGIRAEGNTNFLPLLLREDASEWELRFPPSYYQALARATHTKYTGHSGGTPALYGQLTEKWVYGCLLPSEVHAELKERKHKSEKMHQWLTEGGQELLDKQIALVTNIANSSADLKDFEARMMLVSQKGGQLSMVYPKVA
ncbi:hypothetical protein PAEH1_01490 [Paenalcaligenes hominis]|uniref:KilA-N domain-containing protein n=1 Tax=Paenalcaligenes hominis TaxID=643674 RepID=A0A1U9JXQ4_9BURK|nr:KilA-N domain-containing protein [Paenalcaligenes hominis]AQS50552.1 hypothetical protein PAEH1_01490 [Paenalcaligenes hominis]